MKERITYFDTIRWIAAMFIFTTHFIAAFERDIFILWDEVFPINLFMYGVTGKLAVTVLGVVLGYLAFQKGQKDAGNGNTIRYLLQRYLFFLAAGLVIHILYGAAQSCSLVNYGIEFGDIIENSVFMKNTIVAHWWSMFPFLLGSVLCYIQGKYHLGYREILIEIAVFYLTGQVWISVCLMGSLVKCILDNERCVTVLQKKWIRILIFAILFVILKREESNLTYLIDGIGMSLFILVLCTWNVLQKFFGHKLWNTVNQNYMGVFLIHELVYVILGPRMINGLLMIPYKLRLLIAYVICFVLISVLAKIVDFIVRKVYKTFLIWEQSMWNLKRQK